MNHWVDRLFRVTTLGGIGVYLGLVALYVTPPNPVRAASAPLLDATIGRFFSQDWRLFAPHPADTDSSVLVSCLDEDETKEAVARADAGIALADPGPWFDVTSPLLEAHQRSRFSAYARLNRTLSGSARIAVSMPLALVPWRDACAHGDEASCRFVADQTIEAHRDAELALTRIATSYCRAASPQAVGVSVRVRQRTPVPWSKRESDDVGLTSDLEVVSAPIAEDVEPAELWERR